MDFNKWIRQTSTLHGLGVVAAGIGVALAHVATGNQSVDAVVGIVAYVLVHLGIDDHSAAEMAATKAATDVINASQGHAAPAAIAADVLEAAKEVAKPAA